MQAQGAVEGSLERVIDALPQDATTITIKAYIVAPLDTHVSGASGQRKGETI